MVKQLLKQHGSLVRKSDRQAGAPGPWAADLNNAAEVFEDKQVNGFMLESSYGLSGWILAKEVLVERGSPVPQYDLRDGEVGGLTVRVSQGGAKHSTGRLGAFVRPRRDGT
jgi:hypothetical protein